MKKLLYILTFVPFGLFGQTGDPCYSVNNIYEDVVNQNPPLSIDLSSGWNLIGYPCSESIDAEEALSSIVENIIIVKNNAGSVYMPEFGFNGIGQLETLEGYQIKLFDFVVDFSFCNPIYLPDYLGCTDCESLNFNPFATLDDGSCNYDSDGDGIYDADEIVGCLDQLACNYDNVIGATDNGGCIFPEEGYNCLGLEQNISLGDTAFGGIIFYIDYTGQHGLVASMERLIDMYQWGCHGESPYLVDNLPDIGSGWQNTINIVNSNCLLTETTITNIDGEATFTYTDYEGVNAAMAAYGYVSGGYSDWYLPSEDELFELVSLDSGAYVDYGLYWSSSSSDNSSFSSACSYLQSNPVIKGPWQRKSLAWVRPVRSF